MLLIVVIMGHPLTFIPSINFIVVCQDLICKDFSVSMCKHDRDHLIITENPVFI